MAQAAAPLEEDHSPISKSRGFDPLLIGAVTMKMIRSTSMTSTSGVTLISETMLLLSPQPEKAISTVLSLEA